MARRGTMWSRCRPQADDLLVDEPVGQHVLGFKRDTEGPSSVSRAWGKQSPSLPPEDLLLPGPRAFVSRRVVSLLQNAQDDEVARQKDEVGQEFLILGAWPKHAVAR